MNNRNQYLYGRNAQNLQRSHAVAKAKVADTRAEGFWTLPALAIGAMVIASAVMLLF